MVAMNSKIYAFKLILKKVFLFPRDLLLIWEALQFLACLHLAMYLGRPLIHELIKKDPSSEVVWVTTLRARELLGPIQGCRYFDC